MVDKTLSVQMAALVTKPLNQVFQETICRWGVLAGDGFFSLMLLMNVLHLVLRLKFSRLSRMLKPVLTSHCNFYYAVVMNTLSEQPSFMEP